MIETNCAACGKQLDYGAPKCVRCKSIYCDAACQHDHWRRGHKQMCKKIHRAGNAEQYHADKNYKEAVAEAVEACAADTKGQTCFICTQALHWKTKEGLVRMCACRGTAGFAHVSCLAEQAKILVAEAEDNNLLDAASREFYRYERCSLCEQDYHGVVQHALGWACWKTYLGRPDDDSFRAMSMEVLGDGLYAAADGNARIARAEKSIQVFDAQLALYRRNADILDDEQDLVLRNRERMVHALGRLPGRGEEAIRIRREIYAMRLARDPTEFRTMQAALHLAEEYCDNNEHQELQKLYSEVYPAIEKELGPDHDIPMKLKIINARAKARDAACHGNMDAVRESIGALEETERETRQVLGSSHPEYKFTERALQDARELLAAGPPTRIVLDGLPADIEPPEVRDFMVRWGPLHYISLKRLPVWLCLDGVARAAAVVGFEKRDDALRAVREVEGMRFGDGTIHAFLRPEDE